MKKVLLIISSIGLLYLLSGCGGEKTDLTEESLQERANSLAHSAIIVDGHVDLPYRLHRKYEDVSVRTEKGHFDYVRAKEGGLDAPFMSIYIPASHREKGGGKALADTLIQSVRKLTRENPGKFALAFSPDDVRRLHKEGIIALPLGIENGTALDGNLENADYFYQKGVRYITLAHSENNRICDSATGEKPEWNGLSPFGESLVREMNRLGIMVDVAHISDSSFYDVIRLSQAPVIASHTACRHFTPGFERNISDEMLKALAENGGVANIAFGSYFLMKSFQEKSGQMREHVRKYLKDHHLSYSDSAAQAYIKQYRKEQNLDTGDISTVIDHIDHAVRIAGIDHVGLGSDFDGITGLPSGIEDVSDYPEIIAELLKRGYSEEDIKKICGENMLRTWEKIRQVAVNLQR